MDAPHDDLPRQRADLRAPHWEAGDRLRRRDVGCSRRIVAVHGLAIRGLTIRGRWGLTTPWRRGVLSRGRRSWRIL